MREVSGVTGAAPLWRDVLEAVDDSRPDRRFDRPSGLYQTELCANSEEIASPNCPNHRLEWLPSADGVRTTTHAPPTLRITFPDPGTTIALDPQLPTVAQQLAVEVETTSALTQVDLVVDGIVAAARVGSGTIAWHPTPGRHVLRAESAGVVSESTEIGVVPF